MSSSKSWRRWAGTMAAAVLTGAPVLAQTCPEEQVPLRNYNQAGQQMVCPCFLAGEEAGAVFVAPPEHYPIEILKVRIGWGSVLGGAPQTLENAIHIYPAGLPNPGAPIFSLPAPVMTDGALNQFDLEFIPGNKVINSGPFTVTLEFGTANSGSFFAPSVFSTGPSCTAGKNVIFATPGGWLNACTAGVSGNWAFEVTYRQVNCEALNRDVTSISLSSGGQQRFTLAAGSGAAGWAYWIFGSYTGTSPGIDFPGGINLPLNFDAYFNVTLTKPGFAIFGSFIGVLDPLNGTGFASFNIPPGSDPTLAGATLYHAYVAAPTFGDVQFASNAKTVTLEM